MLPPDEVVRDAESFNAIIDDRLYLGNLSAAESPQLMARLGITHILSVCPDDLEPVADINHLTFPMQDDEQYELLEHLPTTCRFIQEALDTGGRVFVHCVMGISRSATVICAYLMFSRNISASRAIQFVRKCRPRSRPNYNFLRQLQVFSECNFVVSPEAGPYLLWKERQTFDTTHSIRVIDGISIDNRLFLSFDFPSKKEDSTALLEHLGITHIVTISPDRISTIGNELALKQPHKHFIAPYTAKESLLVSLPHLCQFVDAAMEEDNSRVLVHCMDEMRGGIAICAYRESRESKIFLHIESSSNTVMFSRHVQVDEALEILQDRVPLFDDDPVVRRHLDLFEECEYAPSHRHPRVLDWLSKSPPPHSAAFNFGQTSNSGTSYADTMKQKGFSLQARVMSLFNGPPAVGA